MFVSQSLFEICMTVDLTVFSQNSDVKAPTPSVTVFKDGNCVDAVEVT